MASSTRPPGAEPQAPAVIARRGPASPGGGGAPTVVPEKLIEEQIQRTRTQVKLVELATAVVVLGVATLGLLLAAVVVDHWLWPLSALTRWVLLLLYLGGVAWYVARNVLPLLFHRISQVYAAYTIEQHAPGLKNALLNLLLLRREQQRLPRAVLLALEQQAAVRLAHLPPVSPVDRSRLIRWGYVLVGVTALLAVYKFFSPKDPFVTAVRVFAPWSGVAAPTRAQVVEVTPGDVETFTDQFVTVEALVEGIRPGEPVWLHFWSEDGRLDQKLEMTRPKQKRRYQVVLPGGRQGLQETVFYQVLAADAASAVYRVQVVAPPAIAVTKVQYEYPPYTKRPARVVENQGDLIAPEGTRVTLWARANQELAGAWIDLHGDGTRDLRLQVQGFQAQGTLALHLPSSRKERLLRSYQLRIVNRRRQENPQPVRYRVEIVPDEPPVVQILQPAERQIRLPVNRPLALEIQAKDADYALREVVLLGQVGTGTGKLFLKQQLLQEERSAEVKLGYTFRPDQHQLAPGQVIQLKAVARDNRHRRGRYQPNVAVSESLTIHLLEPVQDQPQQQPPQNETKNQQRPQEQEGKPPRQQGKQPQDQSRQGAPQPQRGQQGEQGAQAGQDQADQDQGGQAGQQQKRSGEGQNRPQSGDEESDGSQEKADDAEAFEQILKRLQQQQEPNRGRQGQEQQQGQGQDQQGQQGAGQKAPPQRTEAPQPGAQGGNQQQGGSDSSPQQQQDNRAGAGAEQGNPNAAGGQRPQQGKSRGENAQPPQAGGTDAAPAEDQSQGRGQSTGRRPTGNEPRHQGSATPQGRGDQGSAQRSGDSSRQERTQAESPDKSKGSGEKDAQQAPNAQGRRPDSQARPGTSGDQGRQAQGKGGRAPRSASPEKKQPARGDKDFQAQGGSQRPKGSAGAGMKAEDDKGAGERPEVQNRPKRHKNQGPPNNQRSDEPGKSTTQSKHESDSQGGEKGDKAGGGGEGSGQRANQAGAGGGGQNTAADQGNSKAPGTGKGETGPEAGRQAAADSPTGSQGNRAGAGSQRRAGGSDRGKGPRGQKPPADQPPRGPGEKGQGQKNAAQATHGPSEQNPPRQGPSGQAGGGTQEGGGMGARRAQSPSGQRPSGKSRKVDLPRAKGGDDPNLEYSRRQTALVLQHLKDQLEKGQVDPELLRRLGWTRQELERFVRRWERIQQQARREGPEGERARRLLRNLGLRPRSSRLSSGVPQQKLQRLRQGFRSSVPADQLEQYKAFTQGRNRSK